MLNQLDDKHKRNDKNKQLQTTKQHRFGKDPVIPVTSIGRKEQIHKILTKHSLTLVRIL